MKRVGDGHGTFTLLISFVTVREEREVEKM